VTSARGRTLYSHMRYADTYELKDTPGTRRPGGRVGNQGSIVRELNSRRR
jgi:hypothetical protein